MLVLAPNLQILCTKLSRNASKIQESASPCVESNKEMAMPDGVKRLHAGKACCCKDDLCNESMAKAKASSTAPDSAALKCYESEMDAKGDENKVETAACTARP